MANKKNVVATAVREERKDCSERRKSSDGIKRMPYCNRFNFVLESP